MLRFMRTLLDRGVWINLSWRFWGFKMGRLTFFTDEEVKGLDQELCAKLDWARGRSGIPFVITSGLRTVEQNSEASGVSDSSHLKGLAVDLRIQDASASNRFKMVNALLLSGFKRIGIYDKHCHVDIDSNLPQNVMWTGISS